MKWYRIEIVGWIDREGYRIETSLRARDAQHAVYCALGEYWPDNDVIEHRSVDKGYGHVLRFTMFGDDDFTRRVFDADCDSFEEMATEVTEADQIAALDGHPGLPLGFFW